MWCCSQSPLSSPWHRRESVKGRTIPGYKGYWKRTQNGDGEGWKILYSHDASLDLSKELLLREKNDKAVEKLKPNFAIFESNADLSLLQRCTGVVGVDLSELPTLPPPAEWPSLAELKAELEAEDKDCWDSKLAKNGTTTKTTISSDLYGSKTKLQKITVRIGDGCGGVVEVNFTVGKNGVVQTPRKQGTSWSEIKHVAFVKHGDGSVSFHPVKEEEQEEKEEQEELPTLPSPAEWPSLAELKAELEAEDKDCWDSKLDKGGQTTKKTISSHLYGSKTKLQKITVRIGDGCDGVVEREFTVGKDGRVQIPRKQRTNWSEIKHVAFVKHVDGSVWFHPVKVCPKNSTSGGAGPSKRPRLIETSSSSSSSIGRSV